MLCEMLEIGLKTYLRRVSLMLGGCSLYSSLNFHWGNEQALQVGEKLQSRAPLLGSGSYWAPGCFKLSNCLRVT